MQSNFIEDMKKFEFSGGSDYQESHHTGLLNLSKRSALMTMTIVEPS